MWLSGLAGLLHVPITLLSVEYFGFDGAALSLSLNPWIIFFLYMAYARLCAREKTARCWSPWSAAALQEWGAQQPPACPCPPQSHSPTQSLSASYWYTELGCALPFHPLPASSRQVRCLVDLHSPAFSPSARLLTSSSVLWLIWGAQGSCCGWGRRAQHRGWVRGGRGRSLPGWRATSAECPSPRTSPVRKPAPTPPLLYVVCLPSWLDGLT